MPFVRLFLEEMILQIIETQLAKEDHYVSLYDYICLGYVHFKLGNKEAALEAFTKQEAENDLADNKYYKHLILLDLGQSSEAEPYTFLRVPGACQSESQVGPSLLRSPGLRTGSEGQYGG